MIESEGTNITKVSNSAVKLFTIIFTVTFVLSFVIIYIASEYFNNARLSQFISFQAWDGPGPLPTKLHPHPFGNHFFGDFLLPFRTAQYPSPYFAPGILPFSYFPLAAIMLGPLVFFNYWTAFIIFFVVSIISLLLVLNRGLTHLSKDNRRRIYLLVIASGPMFSMLDRGNLSLILTIFCLSAVLNLQRGNRSLAAVMVGLAGSMKVYPLLFLLVFIRKREWKQFLVGSITFGVSTLIPLHFYDKGLLLNLRELLRQFRASSTPVHAINMRAYNNSLLSFFDSCRTSFPSSFAHLFEFLSNNYSAVGVFFALILVIHATSKYATEFESLLLATVAMVTIPQTVGYYVLLLYFVPLVFLWASKNSFDLEIKLISIAIAIIMVPKGFPLWSPFGLWSPKAATYSSFLNPLCALFITTICIYFINKRRINSLKGLTVPLSNLLDSTELHAHQDLP